MKKYFVIDVILLILTAVNIIALIAVFISEFLQRFGIATIESIVTYVIVCVMTLGFVGAMFYAILNTVREDYKELKKSNNYDTDSDK